MISKSLLLLLASCDIAPAANLYFTLDPDGDGYPWDTANQDCAPGDANVHPDAAETCDGIDQDCDGAVDEGIERALHVDADGDGYGGAEMTYLACDASTEGYVENGSDCDDGDPNRNPSSRELCDGADQDCDGQVDEDVTGSFFQDADGDGYGDPDTSVTSCDETPDGLVLDNTDCDDGDLRVYPGAFEICEPGVDGDCDGSPGCVLGQGGLLSTSDADAVFWGQDDWRLGRSAGPAGDSDGDGRDEFILGTAPFSNVLGGVARVRDSRVDGEVEDGWGGGDFYEEGTSRGNAGLSSYVGPNLVGGGSRDLVVGAPLAGDHGAVFILDPDTTGDSQDPDTTGVPLSDGVMVRVSSQESVDALGGWSVASGTVSDSRGALLAIGVPAYGPQRAGAVILISAPNLPTRNDAYTDDLSPVILTHDEPLEQIGSALTFVENFYGGGGTALLVGGDGYGEDDLTRVLIAPPPTESVTLLDVAVNLEIAGSGPVWLEGAGDLMGDGYPNALIVAATDAGVAAWLANETTVSGDLDSSAEQLFFHSGASATNPRASIADLDNDDDSDLAISSELDGELVVYVFYDVEGHIGNELSPEDADATIEVEGSELDSIVVVTGVGDTNGDDRGDLLLSCWECYSDRGIAWLFYGGS